MQDSFWVDVNGARPGARTLLRTHTSTVQVREMSTRKPPMAVVSGGAVFRRDDDVTHSPMFHQIEGFLVDERVSLAELKGVLTEFAVRLYGPGDAGALPTELFPLRRAGHGGRRRLRILPGGRRLPRELPRLQRRPAGSRSSAAE